MTERQRRLGRASLCGNGELRPRWQQFAHLAREAVKAIALPAAEVQEVPRKIALDSTPDTIRRIAGREEFLCAMDADSGLRSIRSIDRRREECAKKAVPVRQSFAPEFWQAHDRDRQMFFPFPR